jgi:hypothetical protein
MSTMYSIPGIYNVLDYNMTPTDTVGITNQGGLQNAINAAQSNTNGAMVIIPTVDGAGNSGPYKLATIGSSIVSITGNQPILICGTGDGTTLEVLTGGATLFSVVSTPVTFQDLTVTYNQQPTSFLTGTAFNFTNGSNYNLFRVTIINCQNPVVFNNLTQAYMCQSSILYTSAYLANSLTGITITSSAEVWVDECYLSFAGSVASTQVGISVGQSSWTRVTQCEIQNFYKGVRLGVGSATTKGTMLTNVHVMTAPGGIGLQITQSVYDIKVVGSRFENVTSGTAQNIVITSTSGNSSVDTVIFDGCTSTGSIDYGIQIDAGQTVQILGGTYAGNTTAGIAVTGAAAEIQIDGVSCIGTGNGGTFGPQIYGIYAVAGSDLQIANVDCSGTGTSALHGSGIFVQGVTGLQIGAATCEAGSPSHQTYGITVQVSSDVIIQGSRVSGSLSYGIYLKTVTNVTVISCDLYGNTTAGLSIDGGGGALFCQHVYIRNCNIVGYSTTSTILFSGTLNNVAITNCAGYNDRGYLVRAIPPGSGSFSGVTYGYYGPTAFYVTGTGLSITIDAQPIGVTQGSFTLGIGETASISGTPASFYMFGR